MNNWGILYGYELKKLLKRKIFWTAAILCLICTVLAVMSDLMGDYYVDGVKIGNNYNMFRVDKAYEKDLDGKEIAQELLTRTVEGYKSIPPSEGHYVGTEEYQTYARPYSVIFNFMRSAAGMTDSEILKWKIDEKDFYTKRGETLEKRWQKARLSETEKEFWREKESEIKKPFVYTYHAGYWKLSRIFETIGLLILLCVSICLSNIFTEEHTRKTDQLILCSMHGKKGLYWAKIVAGISFSVGFSMILFTVALLLTFSVYGADGFHAAFQLILPDFSYPLTAGQALLILYGILLVTMVIISVFVMVLSEVLHSNIGTLAVMTGILFASMIFNVPNQYRIFSQIWAWLPGSILSFMNVFDVRLLPVFGKSFTTWQVIPVIYILMSLILSAAGKWKYERYQVSGR